MAGRRFLARFLRLFGFCLGESTPQIRITAAELSSLAETSSIPAPAALTDTERLSRYAMNKDDVIVTKQELRYRVFLPAPKEAELSIMRTDALDDEAVWSLGDLVGEASQRRAYGRGDFTTPDVRGISKEQWRLSVRPDEPPPGHAVIEGWPPAIEPEMRKSIAQELRARAKHVIRQSQS